MHTYPQPAHPSYRLVIALRLLAIASNQPVETPLTEDDEDMKRWVNVLYGQAETVSETNERIWRTNLLHICGLSIERAREGIRRCSALDQYQEDLQWVQFQRDSIRALWREESEVATAVAQSVQQGESF